MVVTSLNKFHGISKQGISLRFPYLKREQKMHFFRCGHAFFKTAAADFISAPIWETEIKVLFSFISSSFLRSETDLHPSFSDSIRLSFGG